MESHEDRRVGLPVHRWTVLLEFRGVGEKNMLGSHWHIGNEKDTVLTSTEGWTPWTPHRLTMAGLARLLLRMGRNPRAVAS
jgi:hypothetical protein